MTRLNLRSDKAVGQGQVSTKVGGPPMYLYTKVAEPPHQSRCRSAILLEKLRRMTEFGAEEDTSNILFIYVLILYNYD